LGDGHKGVAFAAQVVDDQRQGFSGVPAPTVGVHDENRPVLDTLLDELEHIFSRIIRDRIGGDDVPLNGIQPVPGDDAQRQVVVGARRQTEKTRLTAGQLVHQLLRLEDLGTHFCLGQIPEIRVAPGVIAELKERVVSQREGLFRMGPHPITAHKERRRGVEIDQGIKNAFVEAGRVDRSLAQVERESDIGLLAVAMGDEVYIDVGQSRGMLRTRGGRLNGCLGR
jgi:hypothetical protein